MFNQSEWFSSRSCSHLLATQHTSLGHQERAYHLQHLWQVCHVIQDLARLAMCAQRPQELLGTLLLQAMALHDFLSHSWHQCMPLHASAIIDTRSVLHLASWQVHSGPWHAAKAVAHSMHLL